MFQEYEGSAFSLQSVLDKSFYKIEKKSYNYCEFSQVKTVKMHLNQYFIKYDGLKKLALKFHSPCSRIKKDFNAWWQSYNAHHSFYFWTYTLSENEYWRSIACKYLTWSISVVLYISCLPWWANVFMNNSVPYWTKLISKQKNSCLPHSFLRWYSLYRIVILFNCS